MKYIKIFAQKFSTQNTKRSVDYKKLSDIFIALQNIIIKIKLEILEIHIFLC